MKRNIMMRVASVMLIAVLLSTCTISGTFAKYVTTESAEDQARVAKFGVVITASGSLFAQTYIDNPDNGADITVKSEGAVGGISNVVAPGTNSAASGLTFALSGAPEVDVKVEFKVNDFEDIVLKAGKYANMTSGDPTDVYNHATDYNPVKFTLTQTNGGGTNDLVAAGTLKDVKDALDTLNTNYAKVDANTNLETTIGTLKLTWAWAFGEATGISGNDYADTILGDLAANAGMVMYDKNANGNIDAGDEAIPSANYSLNTAIDITVTVTQIN